MIRSLHACLLATALLFAHASVRSPRAHAYRTGADLLALQDEEPVTWAATPIKLELSLDAGPVSTTFTEGILGAAMTTWNETRCGGPLLQLDGRTRGGGQPTDGINTVQWVTTGWSEYGPADAAAVTEVEYQEVEGIFSIVETDIYINGETIEWQPTGLSPDGHALHSVLLHELGHVLGLAHPCEPEDTQNAGNAGNAPVCDPEAPSMPLMHPLYQQGSLEVRTDDVNGLCFLYEAGLPRAAEPTEREPMSSAPGEDAGVLPCTGSDCAGGEDREDGGASGDRDASVEDEDSDAGAVDEDPASSPDAEDGGVRPAAHEVGDACEDPSACNGGYCIEGYSDQAFCSRPCADADDPVCPLGFTCGAVEDRDLCVPSSSTREDSSSCSASLPSHSRRGWFFALGFTLLFCLRVRGRRRA